jgi:hypothetical protein
MIEGSLTHTNRRDPDLQTIPKQRFNPNNNLAMDQASLFYAGRIYKQAGAFIQLTYDGIADRLALDNADIRVADQGSWGGENFVYGVSFNNNPTVQDLWNTTPAWGFPASGSKLARTPAAGPVIASFGGQVGGATLYTMINDMLFIEAGAYTTFSKNTQKAMGNWDSRNIRGGAPYWRIALQKNWNGHYLSLGHFGFRADIVPDIATPSTYDRYTDLGVDFNYQYLVDPKHIYEFKASYIREYQDLYASFNQLAAADRITQNLGFFGLNASYTYDQTYTLSFGFNHNHGNYDPLRNSFSANGKSNSQYFTAEIDYVPFGKQAGLISSLTNLRLALQYVGYTKFDGGTANYDGVSGRNVSNNNTLYLNGWLAF